MSAPARSDQRQQPEEDEPPADVLPDRSGDGRADDAGQDPRRRQRREHPRPERFGQRPADGDVGDRLERPGAQALDEAGCHEDEHRRREAADQQADREQAEARGVRHRQTPAVDGAADDDDADERAEEERREDPAVQLDPAELVRDDRHDRRDREGLEADERDGQHETESSGRAGRRATGCRRGRVREGSPGKDGGDRDGPPRPSVV